MSRRFWTLRQRRLFFQRFLWLALLGAGLLNLFILAVYWRPGVFVQGALDVSGQKGQIETTRWLGPSDIELRNVAIADFARAERLRLKWNWAVLVTQQRFELIEVERPQIWTQAMINAFSPEKDKPATSPESPAGGAPSPAAETAAQVELPSGSTWSFDLIRIKRGTLILDNLGEGLPAIPISLGRVAPLEIKNLRLGPSGLESDELQTAQTNQIMISAPIDALSPVLSIDSLSVQFRWSDIAKYVLEEVRITGPTIFLGPELFWFADQFSASGKKKTQNTGAKSPWKIRNFVVDEGKLNITAFGQPGLEMPFTFEAQAKDISLGNLSELNIQNAVIIKEQDLDYRDDYGILVKRMRGDLKFSLPLESVDAKNVVPTLFADSLSWKEIEATDVDAALTFDRNGIYGKFGGKSYSGYVNGGFTVSFGSGFPWKGWINATDVDTQPVAGKLVPEDFSITGKARGEVFVNGRSREIGKSSAHLKMNHPGRFEIKSIDGFLKKIPPEWNSIKKAGTEAVLKAFRTYDYTHAALDLDYEAPTATGVLDLRSDQGNRKFTVNFHILPSDPPKKSVSAVANPEPPPTN
jgi:hypothetical protein